MEQRSFIRHYESFSKKDLSRKLGDQSNGGAIFTGSVKTEEVKVEGGCALKLVFDKGSYAVDHEMRKNLIEKIKTLKESFGQDMALDPGMYSHGANFSTIIVSKTITLNGLIDILTTLLNSADYLVTFTVDKNGDRFKIPKVPKSSLVSDLTLNFRHSLFVQRVNYL